MLSYKDVVRIAGFSFKYLEIQKTCLNKEGKKIGLKIHKGKIKFMTNFQTYEYIVAENYKLQVLGPTGEDGRKHERSSSYPN